MKRTVLLGLFLSMLVSTSCSKKGASIKPSLTSVELVQVQLLLGADNQLGIEGSVYNTSSKD
jgi:hypothetical protein